MKNREVVSGAKDFLPREAALKRGIENRAVETFVRWGYEEIVTPTFEYLDVIESGAGQGFREELFLLQDRDGCLLSLRPEMTIPIARVIATKLSSVPGPLRLFYNANLFRHTQPQIGRYKEFYQVGVELIGAPGPMADAEVIALAAEIMSREGLEFKICLNHIGIYNSLLAASGLDETAREKVKSLVLKKDLVGLGKMAAGLPLAEGFRQVLLDIPVTHGDEGVLERLEAAMKIAGVEEAVSELREVYRLLQVYGLGNNVVVDLGILRGFDYYTGIVFEGYTPGLGYPLLGGGRYDNLLGNFGSPRDATGFAMGIERVLLAVGGREAEKTDRRVVRGADLGMVLAKARELREQGYVVTVEMTEGDLPGVEVIAVEERPL